MKQQQQPLNPASTCYPAWMACIMKMSVCLYVLCGGEVEKEITKLY